MRRIALVAVVFLAFAPAAHAGCGVTSTPRVGSAPLAVTLSATCESATYSWDFGDGGRAEGRTVQHDYAAGAWRPTLVSDTGEDAVAPITAISLKLSAPRLHASVAPHVPVTLRGRRAAGWTAVRATAAIAIVAPELSLGARGASVRALEQRLAELRYAVRRDGYFGGEDLEAVYAFQKVERLARSGIVTPALWARLLHAEPPRPRYGGADHVEIDKTRQVLFLVRGGEVVLVVATSTGATGNTPVGRFSVYRKVSGSDWVLFYPSYFLGGFAVHGYPDVPPYPASHGCARIPMWIAQTVYSRIAYGSTVYVYT